MLSEKIRAEMIYYATYGDYSDAARYEKFALDCNLDIKAYEIGNIIVELVKKTLPRLEPIEILETASATGLTAVGVKAQLNKKSIKNFYTSLDIEQNLLDYAKDRGRGDAFVLGDFNELYFPSEMFDIYIMMGAEGYRDKRKFYQEVYRVLKSDGYFVMPQIGPHPVVSSQEKDIARQSKFTILRRGNYLVAQK